MKRHSLKETRINKWLVEEQAYIALLQKVSLKWKKCNCYAVLYERTRSPTIQMLRYSKAFNRQENMTKLQQGVTISKAINRSTQFVL